MARKVCWLAVFVCLVLGLGLYQKWFSVSGSNTDSKTSDLHVSLNKEKIQEDVKAGEEGIKRGGEAVKDKFNGVLGEKTVAGTVSAIELANNDLTIMDDQKKETMVKVDANTKFMINDKAGVFADLKADDVVSVKYTAHKDGNVATSVTVAKKS